LETYPLVWTLECLALESCGPPTPEQIKTLRQINADMAAIPGDALRRQELDLLWHHTLVEPCGNRRLKCLLTGLKQVVRRYECLYMQDPAGVRRSVQDHAEILEALIKKRPGLAGRLLERNWRTGMESVLAYLDELERAKGE